MPVMERAPLLRDLHSMGIPTSLLLLEFFAHDSCSNFFKASSSLGTCSSAVKKTIAGLKLMSNRNFTNFQLKSNPIERLMLRNKKEVSTCTIN